MNHKDILRKIEELGLKKQNVAVRCMIPSQIFSSYLHGSRNITQEQETRLTEYLKQFDGIEV